jgi:bis(5'-adenosyl)-triphosphatase
VFHLTPYSFAFVNLKPILPGHVLVSPLRRVPRLRDLSPTEVADLFGCVQSVGKMLERAFRATALNVAVQDGVDAGQSVPHVHVHVIPRTPKDMPNTDDVYAELDSEAGDVGAHLRARKDETAKRENALKVDADEARKPRSEEEMVKEAQWLATEMEREG